MAADRLFVACPEPQQPDDQLRQPPKWRDRQEVNHTGTIEERLAAMTPEEQARDAIELVERVRARLAAFRTIEHKPEE